MKKGYDVVIVNYNGEKIIERCLDSVFDSAVTPNKVIILDNASSDNSIELIKQKYPQIELIESNKNIGFAKGNNEAMKRSVSEFILFMNNDLILDKSCATELLSGFNDKDLVVLNPLIYQGWEKRRDQPIYAFGAVLDEYSFNYALYDEEGDREDLNCFSGAAFMARADYMRKTKFENRYFLYYEEPEISARILKEGKKIGRRSKANCYHLESYSSPKNVSGIAFRQFYSNQNKWYMLGKHWPVWQLLKAVVINELHLLVVLGFMIRHLKLNYLKLIYLVPYNFCSGLFARRVVNVKDRAWFSKLERVSFVRYLSLGKKVFSKR